MIHPRRYLPSIAALTALEALDRHGTASAAAAELALTQGAVSRQIQALEGQLGTPLVIRDRQRLTLTPAARDYVREVRRALDILGRASLQVAANPGGGTLALAILPAFGMHWLAPRLARFAAAHPEVTVNLSTRLRPVDFAAEPFDAAIHYGREVPAGLEALPLLEEEVVALAAPALAARAGGRAEGVAGLPLLMIEGRAGDWGRWFARRGLPGLRPRGMVFDQFGTAMQAALHGLGAALLPTFLLGREVEEGRLCPLCGPAEPTGGRHALVWPAGRPLRAPLVTFRAWLAGEVGT
jgi:DNA-binding transcriptional LysR family regulator